MTQDQDKAVGGLRDLSAMSQFVLSHAIAFLQRGVRTQVTFLGAEATDAGLRLSAEIHISPAPATEDKSDGV